MPEDNKPKKQSELGTAIMITVGIAAVIFVIFRLINAGSELSGSISRNAQPETYQVKYQINCESCSVTYATRSGIEQLDNVDSDWTYSFKADRFTAASISAQNNNESGNVTAAIFVNGKMMEHSKSSGAYVIASANLFLE